MAKIEIAVAKSLQWEGGKANDKLDRGGLTKMGVTLTTWKQLGIDKNGDGVIDAKDLMLMTREDAINIYRHFWNRWQANKIVNQSVANILADWVWCSGAYGIMIPQRILGLKKDGYAGSVTLEAVNKIDPELFFDLIHTSRVNFVENICNADPTQYRFLNGWKNRINSFHFEP